MQKYLLIALALLLGLSLFSCSGTRLNDPGNALARNAAEGDYGPLTVDLIAGGGVDGDRGWDAGDVTVEYSADGNTLSVNVVLADGVTFAEDPVKLYASTVKPDSSAVIPGTGLPYTLDKSDDDTSASGEFDLDTAGANLYLLLHAVVCREVDGDGGGGDGTTAWSTAFLSVPYSWDIKAKGKWETHTGDTTTTGEIISGSVSNLAGHYTLSTDSEYFKICIDLEDGYALNKLHFWYGAYTPGTTVVVFDQPSGYQDIPVIEGNGSLDQGHFPYELYGDTFYNPYDPYVEKGMEGYWDAYTDNEGHDYCIKFLLTDIFTDPEFEGCIPFIGALHLDLDYTDSTGTTHVTGWGEQPFDWNSGMFFAFEICQYPGGGGGGGEMQCNTAWAEDPTPEDTTFTQGKKTYPCEYGFFKAFPWSDGGSVNKWGWVFYYPGAPADGPWV